MGTNKGYREKKGRRGKNGSAILKGKKKIF